MILADTGFWIGLQIANDRWHRRAHDALRGHDGETLVTTWPVITEVCYFLNARLGAHAMIEFMRDLRAGICEIQQTPPEALPRIETLMHKYRDLPMDLADASLVVLAEELGEGRIFSTDERDFGAYRWKNSKPFKNLLVKD